MRKYRPECILMSKTKVYDDSMLLAMRRLGFLNCVSVPTIKNAGGFCFAWMNGFDFRVTFADKNAINGMIFSDPPSRPWMITAVYGPPYRVLKEAFWNKM